MHARLLIAAAFLMAGAGAASAEPVRTDAPADKAEASHSAQLVLASVEDGDAPEAAQQQQQSDPAPRPHRAARVTTCRCGDPQQH